MSEVAPRPRVQPSPVVSVAAATSGGPVGTLMFPRVSSGLKTNPNLRTEGTMSRTVSMLLIGAVLLVGCSRKDDESEKTDNKTAGSGGSNTGSSGVGGNDSDECNPIGTWQATVTTTNGDCFPEGISEEMTIDF